MQYVIGIDEAGRGALAGPVSAGAVLMPHDFDWREVFALVTRRGTPRLRDSKQLSPQQRNTLFECITAHGGLRYTCGFVEARGIDEIGIVNSAREAAAVALRELGVRPGRARVLLDAGLSVSSQWEQEAFVRGDENIPAIALASIIAKVTRDRHMDDLALAHPHYGFERHKGYGTREHYAALRAHGPLPIHRKTFLSHNIS